MKLFISWSGQQSGIVASALRSWIPKVVQAVQPWLSSSDIQSGERWSNAIDEQLLECKAGILCLTRENLSESWILFEAGALSKVVGRSMVIPYLIDLEPVEVKPPLGLLQGRRADPDGTFMMIDTLNKALGENALQSDVLRETFDLWWARLSEKIDEARNLAPTTAVAPRKVEDMIAESLEILRAQERRVTEREAWTSATSALAQRMVEQRAQDWLLTTFSAEKAGAKGMSAVAEFDTIIPQGGSTIPSVGRLLREREKGDVSGETSA